MFKKILLVSFGKIEKEIINKVSDVIQKTFKIKVMFFNQMPVPWTAQRENQLKASDFLVSERELLENNAGMAVLGITKKDLYVPELSFVFGLASPEEQVAIVSLARLDDENKKLFIKRIKKEVIHEMGHIFNLNHCQDESCVMRFSNNVADVDFKRMKFCSSCQSDLRLK